MSKLTHSLLSTLRSCPRRYYYRYELGLSRIRSADALRIGSVFHLGLETRDIAAATAGYDQVPQWVDPVEWEIERQTVANLLAGHFWRYSADALEFVTVERVFEMPLVNPETDRSSRLFTLAGKIDAIVRLPDGRLAVLEYKTAGENIGPTAEYWLRLRCDPQISMYVLAARSLGFDVATVLYDVTRKPSIAPKQVPTLDDQGRKIVLDAGGNRVFKKNGEPRESGSAADGYVLQSRVETPAEFGKRLLDDIGDRPDFYFARREVPRLEDELIECRHELWQQAQQLNEARSSGRWFRNVGRNTCGYCQFSDLCLNSVNVNPDSPPAGFEILADLHPELSEE